MYLVVYLVVQIYAQPVMPRITYKIRDKQEAHEPARLKEHKHCQKYHIFVSVSMPVIELGAFGQQIDPKWCRALKVRLRSVVGQHTWSTGQDAARAIKQLLKEVLPGISIFLDVRRASALRISCHSHS